MLKIKIADLEADLEVSLVQTLVFLGCKNNNNNNNNNNNRKTKNFMQVL